MDVTADELARMRADVKRHGCLFRTDALELLRAYEAARTFAETAVAPRPVHVTLMEAEQR